MVLSLLIIVLGLVLLVGAAEVTSQAGTRLARSFGIPPLLVGLTLTSIGTSLPEVATNLAAGTSGRLGTDASGVAIGNVLGSNMTLVTVLLAVTALVVPVSVPPSAIRRDGAVVMGALVAMGALAFDGKVSAGDGALLLFFYVGYLAALGWSALNTDVERIPGEPVAERAPRRVRDPIRLLAGIAGVVLAANLIVTQGTKLAEAAGIPAVLVGIGVGVGTSLPELAVTLRAARSNTELALGGLLGSAVANPLLALSAGALIFPVTVEAGVLGFDWAFTVVSTGIALILMSSGNRLERNEAGVLVLLFVLYGWLRLFVV